MDKGTGTEKDNQEHIKAAPTIYLLTLIKHFRSIVKSMVKKQRTIEELG